MSVTRRMLVLAIVTLAAVTSLVLASSATAATGPITTPTTTQQLVTLAMHDDAIRDCRAKGGTWTEGPDPLNPGHRIGKCTWEECTLKWFRVGSISIPYKKCIPRESPTYMWRG